MTDLYTPADKPNGGSALRMALIIVPLIGVIVVLTLKLMYDRDFELSTGRRMFRGLITTFAYPLSSLALGLWAANALKPIGWLSQSLLKRSLITFAILMPIMSAINLYDPIMMMLKNLNNSGGIPSYVSNYASGFFGSLSFGLVCYFAACKTDVTHTDDDVTF